MILPEQTKTHRQRWEEAERKLVAEGRIVPKTHHVPALREPKRKT